MGVLRPAHHAGAAVGEPRRDARARRARGPARARAPRAGGARLGASRRIALRDRLLWSRWPALRVASLFRALGMGLLVAVLTVAIGKQPVALVQEGHGPIADRMAHLL